MELQADSPPFGGLVPGAVEDYANVFASPGPIFEPAPRRTDPFRLARALFAAGVRKGDLVHNTFSYHFTPAGAMLEGGARAIGCTVFPAGVGQTELQVQVIARLRPNTYVGTPSFLNILLDKAAELGEDVSSIDQGPRLRRGASSESSRRHRRARRLGPAVLRDRGCRPHRLRVSGARRDDPRRRRHRGDRAAGHR